MHFVHIVFAVAFCVVINFHLVKNQDAALQEVQAASATTTQAQEESEDEDSTPADKHTFVALIDIVFTDGAKRSCTGAVIHDNVVITAAHCFIDCNNEYVTPELTLSFVVIGTKNMFEAGYEQYLPIERVVTHPRFKGWTADLALVYTFAGMMSDKPGQVIPLAGERSATPVDSNVTVISWGKCRDDLDDSPLHLKSHLRQIPHVVQQDQHLSQGQATKARAHTRYPIRYPNPDDTRYERYEQTRTRDRARTRGPIDRDRGHERDRNHDRERERSRARDRVYYQQRAQPTKTATIRSRYLTSEESSRQDSDDSDDNTRTPIKQNPIRVTANPVDDDPNLKIYKNWRRTMGSQRNQLTVEVFGFVNVQACKKLVERAMPSMYSIKNGNEILCYSSEEHYITKEDSGAPALQQGHLVAVTVGGVETDGDHIAIGMKMSCFCPWIAENLPEGGGDLKCCKNCCDNKRLDDDDKKKNGRQRRMKAKFYRLEANGEAFDDQPDFYEEEKDFEDQPQPPPPIKES